MLLFVQLEGVKAILLMQNEEKDLQRFVPLLLQNSFHGGAHRSVKILSYLLLRNLSSTCDLDWGQIVGTVFSDIQSIDAELQKNAFMTLFCLPMREAIDCIKSYEQLFIVRCCDFTRAISFLRSFRNSFVVQQYLDNKEMEGFHAKYHCLEYMPRFLINLYIKISGDESFTIKDIVK